jgi:predicted DNA-binding antitoxin AbrB/MazE fold protein
MLLIHHGAVLIWELPMPITIDAIYEGGALKPSKPLQLEEKEKVTITIHSRKSVAQRTYGMVGWTGDAETVERVALEDEFGLLESP